MMKLPDNFDTPTLLADNLWLMGNYYFNLYLVQGTRGAALIEMGVSAISDAVIRQLEALDIAPTHLIVTHPHSDHLTGLPGLQERYPDAVAVFGQGAKEFLEHPKSSELMVKEDRFITRRLAANGIRSDRPPIEGFRFPQNHMIVSGTREIDLGGTVARCLPVSGHAPGNMAVHVPAMGALMVSDSLGFRFPGRCYAPLFFTGYTDYLATLDELATLEPQILGLAHQGPLTATAEIERAFSRARQAAVDLHAEVFENLDQPEEMADRIFHRYYKDEFTLYTEQNIRTCARLLVRRAAEALDKQ